MSTFGEVMEAIEKNICEYLLPLSFDPELSDEEISEMWAKTIICGNCDFARELANIQPVNDVEEIIECLQNESIITLCGIEPDMVRFFEDHFQTDSLSELIEWAQDEYEDEKDYINQVMNSLEREFERRVHDTALGRLDPEGYSIDPDYDSSFDVNHDEGIAFEKIMSYDKWVMTGIKKADSPKLIEAMLQEGFDMAACRPQYVNALLIRHFDSDTDSFIFTEKEAKSIDLIIENGYDINKLDEIDGISLLRYAVRAQNLDAVKYLISIGADPYAGTVSLSNKNAQLMISLGFSEDLFNYKDENHFTYIGKDGIMIQSAFNGDKDMLDYLKTVIGICPNYDKFIDLMDEVDRKYGI